MVNKLILILILLILPLQTALSQINDSSAEKLENDTNVITEDALVGEKLEQVQNQSKDAGKLIEELVPDEPKKE
ncbi:MAG TPA: hypothetical protein VF084_12485 [Nitrososphaeraceae archaeon]|jgi:hypothetical protein